MDGYSVEEAAQVLGIPEGRVWELIARGVLAGASEGRADMRVFLRPPSGGLPPVGTEEPARRSNDGETGSTFEASPFRELLSEYRNLTERYGQALLALGEARGEVASLRSRVDLLEARMDMRLPLRAASTVAWELPDRYAAERAADPGPPPTEPPAGDLSPASSSEGASEPAPVAETETPVASPAEAGELEPPVEEEPPTAAPQVTVVFK